MKILIVCSHREYISDGIAPFIKEQVDATRLYGIDCDYFVIKRKGVIGYLKSHRTFLHKIKTYKPDIIHAHYGLCGLFANLQRKIPVVTTYHGSDINNPNVYKYSRWALRLSWWNIIVSPKQESKIAFVKNYSIIPCGVDMNLFPEIDKAYAREQLKLEQNRKYILFSKNASTQVKNFPLAKAAIDKLNISRKHKREEAVELLELWGYSHSQVAMVMNAVDVAVLTSFAEGSPQFIKEVMACGCPIVSVDVGDVRERVEGVEGCYVARTYERDEIVELLEKALLYNSRTNGRKKIISDGLANYQIAQQIIGVYKKVLEVK